MPGIKLALGENPKRPGGGAGGRQGPGPARYPATRMGVEYVIRDAFDRAKAYQQAWQDYDRRRKNGETVVAPRRDLQLEPLVEVLEGKRLVHAHSYRADEILMLLRIADRPDLLEVYPYQRHLKNYVQMFRRQYRRERGRHGPCKPSALDDAADQRETVRMQS